MKTIFNFLKNLFCDSGSDMIGLSTIKTRKPVAARTIDHQNKKECTLTEMLRRTY